MNAIEIEGLYFKYNKNTRYLFENFSLFIKRGEKIGLIGGNGVGKSTLVKLILGICEPTKGNIRIEETIKDWEDSLPSIGYVGDPGYNTVLLGLPINSNVETLWTVLNRIYGERKSKEFDELLEEMDLKKLLDKQIKYLSTGERKRIMLSMIFYKNPPIVILDEPLDGLDKMVLPYTKKRLSEMTKNKDKTVIYISHNKIEVDLYSDMTYELSESKLNLIKRKKYNYSFKSKNKEYDIKNASYNYILAQIENELEKGASEIELKIRTSP